MSSFTDRGSDGGGVVPKEGAGGGAEEQSNTLQTPSTDSVEHSRAPAAGSRSW